MSPTLARPRADAVSGRSRPVDPRASRTSASVTVLVLSTVLLLPAPYGVGVLAVQTAVFAVGAVRGVHATPYGWLFRRFVRPRLGPPSEWEAPQPPRFAQGVGLGFAVVGLVALLAGATLLGQVALGAALAAALLNAVFGFCLGCEAYLLGRRAIGDATTA